MDIYAEEKEKATKFLNEFGNDPIIIDMLCQVENEDLTHSDRWSLVFDILHEHYPHCRTGALITGIVCLVEEGMKI
jgi:hypothetical protein